MNTKTLSHRALSIIDQYLHFKLGSGTCSVPYFNNKVGRARAALRAMIGKGSPQEIYEEIMAVLVKGHVDQSSISDDGLKKALTDANIGIDCSGFAYYILNAECLELKKGSLDKHMRFIRCKGIIGKIRCALRPIENCDVATFADETNGREIPIDKAQPGDIVTMIGGPDAGDRDHILVVHQIEYQNFAPIKIHYTHAIAYPEDGVYGTGVRQGTIEIADAAKPIASQIWTENGLSGSSNRLFVRAQKSQTTLRRLNALKQL